MDSLILILALTFAGQTHAMTFSGELKAGAAVKVLGAPTGISMAGFGGGGRRNWGLPQSNYAHLLKAHTHIHDEPSVRALVLEWKNEKIALISLDLVASSVVMRQELGRRLQDIGIEEKNIFLTATHTHSGPSSFAPAGLWQIIAADTFLPEVLEKFTDSVESAIREANKNRVPSGLGIKVTTIKDAVNNRRSGKLIEPQLTLIRVDDLKGQSIATVINFPIHGTFLNSHSLELSADIAGSIERHFETKTGGVAVFINSSEGDVSPANARSDVDVMEEAGERMATQIYSNWQNTLLSDVEKIQTTQIQQPLGQGKLNASACVNMGPFTLVTSIPPELPQNALMSGLAINNHVFVGVPGEPTMAVGEGIKKAGFLRGFDSTSIFGLTNDHISYIVTEEEYKAGGYESCSSLYGSDISSKIQSGAERVFNEMLQKTNKN